MTNEEGKKLADKWREEAKKSGDRIGEIMFMETSALQKTNVEETFKGLVRLMKKGKPAGGAPSGGAAPAAAPAGGAATAPDAPKESGDKGGGCKCVIS